MKPAHKPHGNAHGQIMEDKDWGSLPVGGLRNLMGLMEDIKAKDDAIEALLASLDADALNPEQFNAYCRLEALIKPPLIRIEP